MPRKKPLDRVRAVVERFPEAYEEETWGHPTFRVNLKIFAIAGDDSLSCKADPDERPALATRPWFFEPAYVARHGWIGIRFADVDDWDEVAELLETAYRMTAPKRLLRSW